MHARIPHSLMFFTGIGLFGLYTCAVISGPARDMDMTWIEKYVTYTQDHHGQLQATDYHFMAEVIYAKRSTIKNVVSFLFVEGSDTPLASYAENDPFAFTNGLFYTRKSESFNDLASLEAAHPATGHYVWEIHGPGGDIQLDPIRIGGPELRTRIPDTSPIYLSQSGRPVTDFNNIEPDMSLGIGWDPFTIGARWKEPTGMTLFLSWSVTVMEGLSIPAARRRMRRGLPTSAPHQRKCRRNYWSPGWTT